MKKNDYLAHYASPYYDPAKAHEYYMRTRELKGRRKASYASPYYDPKEAHEYYETYKTRKKRGRLPASTATRAAQIAKNVSDRLDALDKEDPKKRKQVASEILNTVAELRKEYEEIKNGGYI